MLNKHVNHSYFTVKSCKNLLYIYYYIVLINFSTINAARLKVYTVKSRWNHQKSEDGV